MEPMIRRPDCVVDVSQERDLNMCTINLQGAYKNFARMLLPLHRLFNEQPVLVQYDTQDISTLRWLGDAGGTTRMRGLGWRSWKTFGEGR